ncbi:MAG: aminoacyl-tRNA deacylase [Clostridia bacterium]|nr:aminoacyl-tRNA deacylase [Clostridia bacterium]
MGKKEEKTNAMRILDSLGVRYERFLYENAGNAAEIAATLGFPPDELFKTLVTVGRSGGHYVFMIRSDGELDLKKAARAAGEKAVEMIPQKDLLPLTGYIHGGCSPIGMKKPFPAFLDGIAAEKERICCSGGRVGCQIRLTPAELIRASGAALADLVRE